MAQNRVDIEVNVSDQGSTNKLNDKVTGLRKNLESAADAAGRVNVGNKLPSESTAGSRAAAYKATANTGAASQMTEQTYGSLRGTAGATGSSARDFAKQSQGLDGIVRLYATLAANIYAVSAAFTALSSAMDTANMAKGLEQLGAYSGKNLGALSKRLIEATDGAISLSDAMRAVAQGSAANISNANLERMAKVAKTSSQALGINMTDAMQRMTRGVTKLEPELLDELGIMVKLDAATNNYARSIGKLPSQLTDAEKRQAFLNEVLKQGEEKFGNLQLDANPFTKLAAAIDNLSKSGLALIGGVLSPIVNFLSSSPVALSAIMAALATMLVTKAIPAIKNWRDNIRAGLEEARKEAEISKRAFEEVKSGAYQRSPQGKAKSELDTSFEKVKNLEGLHSSVADKLNKNFQGITASSGNLGKAVGTSIADLIKYEQKLVNLTEKVKDPAIKAATEAEILAIRKKKEELKALIAAQEKSQQLDEAASKKPTLLERFKKPFTVEGRQEREALTADRRIKGMDLLSTTLENQESLGYKAAMDKLKTSVKDLAKDPSFGLIRANFLGIRIAAIATATAVGSIFAALQPFIILGTVILEIISIIDNFASSGKKELEAFNKSVEDLNASAESMLKTTEVLQKKNIFDRGNIDSVIAVSNAFTDFADAVSKSIKKVEEAKQAMGAWSGFKNFVSKLWGGDVDSQLADGLGSALANSIKLLEASGRGEEFKREIGELLKVTKFDSETLTTAYANAGKEIKDKVASAFEEVKIKINQAAGVLQSFRSSLETMSISYQDFVNSTAATDPLFKLGASIQTFSTDIGKLLAGPVQNLQAGLNEIVKDPRKIAALGPDIAMAFVNLGTEIQKDLDKVKTLNEELKKVNTSLQSASAAGRQDISLVARRESLEKEIKETEGNAVSSRFERIKSAFTNAMTVASNTSVQLIQRALGNAIQAAEVTIQKARNQILTGPRAVAAEADLARKDIELKQAAIKGNIELISSQERLAATIAAQTAATSAETLSREAKEDPKKQPQADLAFAQSLAAKTVSDILKQFTFEDLAKKSQQDFAQMAESLIFRNMPDKSTISATDLKFSIASVVSALINLTTKVSPQLAALRKLAGEKTAVDISEVQKTSVSTAQENLAGSERRLAGLQSREQEVRQLESIAGLSTEIVSLSRQELVNQELINRDLAKRKTIVAPIEDILGKDSVKTLRQTYNQLANTLGATSAEATKAFDNFVKAATASISESTEKDTQRKRAEVVKILNEAREASIQDVAQKAAREEDVRYRRLTRELAIIDKKYEVTKAQAALEAEVANVKLNQEASELSANATLYGMSERSVALIQKELDVRKAHAERLQAVSQIQTELNQKMESFATRRTLIESSTLTTPAEKAQQIADLEQQEAREQRLAVTAMAGAKVRADAAIAQAELNKKVSDEQERYNVMLEKTTGIAESIKSAFEGANESIVKFTSGLAQAVSLFGQMQVQSDKNAKNIENIGEALKKAQKASGLEDTQETIELEKEKSKTIRKSQQDEIKGYAGLAGAAKNMFKEKTFAYKAFAVIEKTLQAASLALKIKELFFDNISTTQKVANNTTKMASDTAAAGVSGVRAILDALQGGPPMSFIMGGLMAALVASLLSSIGGSKSVSMPAVPDAGARLDASGTAQAYDKTNQLVQYRTGVLGDPSARSTTITDALESMDANSIESLAYSYKMVTALLAIKAGINNLAGIFKATPGLVTGTINPERREGITQGGGFIRSQTREIDIQESGIKISGTIDQILNNFRAQAVAFQRGVENVNTTYLGFFNNPDTNPFYDERTLEEVFGKVGADRFANVFTRTLSNSLDMAAQVGTRLGYSEEDITNLMRRAYIDPLTTGLINLRDAGGDVAAIAEGSVMGIVDVMTQEFLSGFAEFADESSEDIPAIAMRVINQLDTFVRDIGQTVDGFNLEQALQDQGLSQRDAVFGAARITQDFIDLLGGDEGYTQAMEQFNDAILTEEERMQNKRETLSIAMRNAGLQDITTLEQLRAAQRQAVADMSSTDANLSREGARRLADIVRITPAFVEIGTAVSEMLEKVKKAFKLTEESLSSLFLDVLKSAKSASEAQVMAQEKASKLIYESILDTAAKAISETLFDAALQPLIDGIIGSAATAASTTVAGGAAAGASVAAGGIIAGDALAEAVGKAKVIIQAMGAILRDPEFQIAMRDITSTIGTAASEFYMAGLPGTGPSAASFDLTKFLEDINKEITNTNKQLRQLSMTSYDRAIDDLNEKVANYERTLRDAGETSAQATEAVNSFREAQLALLNAQNKAKATDIITGIQRQMSDELLGPVGKELANNTRQAQDYVKQLRDINQLTEENIRVVNEWESTTRRRIIDNAIKTQNQAYDQLFGTTTSVAQSAQALSVKFSALGYTMPKGIKGLQQLVDGIDYTTEAGLTLRGQLIELAQEYSATFTKLSDAVRSAFDQRVQELTSARDEFKNFANSIREFKQSLLVGAESPLNPFDKYATAQQEFIRVSALAQTGDKLAMSQLQQVSQTFLEQSRGMFAGTESYVRDFNAVLGVLEGSESAAEIQMTTAMDTLQGVRDTVSALITVQETITDTNTILTGFGTKLETAIASYAQYTGLDLSTLPEFAIGTNYVPENMVAKIHKGERVIPAADNAKLMSMMQQEVEVVAELQNLNLQVKELTQVVAQGSVMNNNSTNKNTDQLVAAVDNLQKTLVYVQKVQGKAMIV